MCVPHGLASQPREESTKKRERAGIRQSVPKEGSEPLFLSVPHT